MSNNIHLIIDNLSIASNIEHWFTDTSSRSRPSCVSGGHIVTCYQPFIQQLHRGGTPNVVLLMAHICSCYSA